MYGAARLVYTIEIFRQKAYVPERLSDKVNVDLRIGVPQRSSFLQQVIIAGAPLLAECAFKVPLEAMFAHVWSTFGIASRNEGDVSELARLQYETARFELSRDKQATKQLEAMRDVAEKGFETHQMALGVIKDLIAKSKSDVTSKQLKETEENLQSRQKTAALTREHQEELSRITPQQEIALTSKISNAIGDLSVPLRNSARSLRVGFAANDNTCAYLTFDTANWITRTAIDRTPTLLTVRIKNFDRETGYGRFRYEDFKRPLAFRLPKGIKRDIFENIVDGLKKEEITISGYFVKDRNGTPRSFLVDDILSDDIFS